MTQVICAEMTATVWKILVAEGQPVTKGTELAILESMKMEIPLESTCDGVVVDVLVSEGTSVFGGMRMFVIDPSSGIEAR